MQVHLKMDGSCEYPTNGYNCDGTCVDSDGDGVCDLAEINGCSNYDQVAFIL